MSKIEEVMGNIDSKLRKRLRTAEGLSTERYALPSIGVTDGLGGGFGGGRIATVHGSKSAGKSSAMLQAIGSYQKDGKVCAWIDAEKAYDSTWADRLGVDSSSLIVSRAADMERCGDEAVALIEAGVDVLVIDSISALIQPSYLNDDGSLAGMKKTNKIGDFSSGLKSLIRSINYVNEDALVVLISQQTTYIGQSYTKQVPEGGNAIEYYSSQVVKLNSTPSRKIVKSVKSGDKTFQRVVGREVDWTVQYNKLGRDGATGTYEFYHTGDRVGVDSRLELANLAEQRGIVEKAGAWYKYKDEKFHGSDKFVAWLDDQDNLEELKEQVYAAA